MKEKLIMLCLMVAFSAAIFFAGYFKGQGSCQSKQSAAIIKEVKNEAQAFANRPRTRDDRVDRLCNAARTRAKSEGKSLKRFSCPIGN